MRPAPPVAGAALFGCARGSAGFPSKTQPEILFQLETSGKWKNARLALVCSAAAAAPPFPVPINIDLQLLPYEGGGCHPHSVPCRAATPRARFVLSTGHQTPPVTYVTIAGEGNGTCFYVNTSRAEPFLLRTYGGMF
eukprot:gene22620-375_t